jgi:hypothetical protein
MAGIWKMAGIGIHSFGYSKAITQQNDLTMARHLTLDSGTDV